MDRAGPQESRQLAGSVWVLVADPVRRRCVVVHGHTVGPPQGDGRTRVRTRLYGDVLAGPDDAFVAFEEALAAARSRDWSRDSCPEPLRSAE